MKTGLFRQFGLIALAGLLACTASANPSRTGLDEQAYRRHLQKQVDEAREKLAEQPAEIAYRRNLAMHLYYLGIAGSKEARREAEDRFEQLHHADPADRLSAAYLGSLLLRRAPDAWAPWDKAKLSKRGLELLDTAVAADPEDVHVRWVRGATTSRLPDGFERQDQARADIAMVAGAAESAVAAQRIPASLAAAALIHHARHRLAEGDAEEARLLAQRAIELAPRSHAAWQAQEMLAQ